MNKNNFLLLLILFNCILERVCWDKFEVCFKSHMHGNHTQHHQHALLLSCSFLITSCQGQRTFGIPSSLVTPTRTDCGLFIAPNLNVIKQLIFSNYQKPVHHHKKKE